MTKLTKAEIVAAIEVAADHCPGWILQVVALLFIPRYYLQLGRDIVLIREDIDRRVRALDK